MDRRSFLKAMFASGAAAASALGGRSVFAGAWAMSPDTSAALAARNPLMNDLTLHILNRVTWGYRTRDREQLERMGATAFIEAQLNPETIDDPLIDSFMEDNRYLNMDYVDLNRAAGDNYSRVMQQMLWARLYRAAYSERQLFERMVEFWTDHFNVPIGDLLSEKIIDDRDVIRRHALGNFRDLLLASARSPAMLRYLDNASSTAEYPNENYAREVMELHTLGVDGGYTEDDVREVARALTGWTTRDGWQDGFYFNRDDHDAGEKVVLGRTLPAGRGIEDGLDVLDLLATHPSTAYFISRKLVRRFVSDDAPRALVESTAQVFKDTDGDLRAVMRHILTSAEFIASAGQKYRRPMEYLIAMMRALDTALTTRNRDIFVWALEPMGHIPFHWHPPNGYPDGANAWINTNGLLQRWNLAMLLPLASEEWIEDVSLDLGSVLAPQATVGEAIDAASQRLLGGQLAPEDRALLISTLFESSNAQTPLSSEEYGWFAPTLMGVLFSSPYFQWA